MTMVIKVYVCAFVLRPASAVSAPVDPDLIGLRQCASDADVPSHATVIYRRNQCEFVGMLSIGP